MTDCVRVVDVVGASGVAAAGKRGECEGQAGGGAPRPLSGGVEWGGVWDVNEDADSTGHEAVEAAACSGGGGDSSGSGPEASEKWNASRTRCTHTASSAADHTPLTTHHPPLTTPLAYTLSHTTNQGIRLEPSILHCAHSFACLCWPSRCPAPPLCLASLHPAFSSLSLACVGRHQSPRLACCPLSAVLRSCIARDVQEHFPVGLPVHPLLHRVSHSPHLTSVQTRSTLPSLSAAQLLAGSTQTCLL